MKATISILLLALFFTLNHSQASLRIPHFNNSTDQDVLLSFKAQVTKDPNGVLDTWKPNTSFCNWHGVLCNPMKNRVTGLTLRNLTLAGTITSYIANLSFLRRLDLQENSFHGTIPIDFGRLFRLVTLILASNNIHRNIPSSLGLCSRLQVIDLSDNQLQGTIPSELGNLLELQDLSFAKNNLSGNIPSSLGNCSSLNNLILLSNNLQGTIPTELAHLSLLLQLNLGNNNLSGEIPPSLFNISSLLILGLAKNQISGHLPSNLFTTLPNINTLFVGGNLLQGHIPGSLSNASSLEKLDLSTNLFTGKVPLLWNLPNIQILNLEINMLVSEGEHGLDFITSLSNSTSLRVFSVATNKLTVTFLPQLATSQTSSLWRIPSSLSSCQRLQLLDLSINGLRDNIPKEIFSFPNLATVLNLSWNSLSGSLPSEIGTLKMVQGIDISNNRLSGAIPTTVGVCSNLLYLDLSSNSFQGLIPDSLEELRGIEYIDLSTNNLSALIPSLGTLKYLQLLNLSANKLQGEVPKGGIFSNTSAVFLSGNPGLCGGLPVLELPNCPATGSRSSSSRTRKMLIVGLTAGAAAMCILIVLFMFLIMKRKKKHDPTVTDVISFEGPPRLYSYYVLKSATNNFSSENLIGEGSFGCVYRGVMRDGTLAAVKVFNMDQHGASRSFLAECEALRYVRHRNLVKILSACSSPTFKALVLQFMPNGSLEKWLHHGGEDGRQRLNLKQRMDIVVEVASAMEYLHHNCETPVVHCDLKPSNVLLDQDMTAHVGDFGLARILHGAASDHQISSTLGLKGSIGYIAPEYGLGGGVSTKGDVYCFGILVLEMFTGKKPTQEMFSGEFSLRRWVEAAVPDQVMGIVDNELEGDCKILGVEYLNSVIQIGLSCASEKPEDRPDMKDVSAMMEKTRAVLFTAPTVICNSQC
ncbi:putative LRR receptor-like serine/threonine-protein kinase [Vitis vinifera]|uniref:non-specific serine/threonine protein kinase n=1 Tax=Vitis vinifera TaxID=29760 RepID=A0A438HSJ3_VITVI|nr:putative LRR receptor-like serine/threonine-protein kinase [Vitis vinifera]